GVGARASAVWLSTDHRAAQAGWLEDQPQASVSFVGGGGTESAAETAKKAGRWQSRRRLPAASGATQGPRVDLGLHLRSYSQRAEREDLVDRRRVHARMPGAGGQSQV